MNNLITVLNALGFSENEAKVYMTLLKSGQMNGYEASKASGVPRSKIYMILERLLQKGVLSSSNNGKYVVYKAEPVSRIEQMAKDNLDQTLSALRTATEEISEVKVDDQIWNISGYRRIMLQAEEMIRKAKKRILIQIWNQELNGNLEQALYEMTHQINSVVILYDESGIYKHRLANVYQHGFEQRLLEEKKTRWLTCVIDDQEVLYATIPNTHQSTAIYTKDHSMVWFAAEYVIHDAYCLKLIRDFAHEAKEKYGEHLMGLRDIFTLN